jgi:septal ring factor EnvC (AmiA/AmiB activator)
MTIEKHPMPVSNRTPPSASQLQRQIDELKSTISAQKREITRLQRKLVNEETKNLSSAARIKALEADRIKNAPKFSIVVDLGDDEAKK